MSKRIAAVAAAVLLSLACMVFAVLGGCLYGFVNHGGQRFPA